MCVLALKMLSIVRSIHIAMNNDEEVRVIIA